MKEYNELKEKIISEDNIKHLTYADLDTRIYFAKQGWFQSTLSEDMHEKVVLTCIDNGYFNEEYFNSNNKDIILAAFKKFGVEKYADYKSIDLYDFDIEDIKEVYILIEFINQGYVTEEHLEEIELESSSYKLLEHCIKIGYFLNEMSPVNCFNEDILIASAEKGLLQYNESIINTNERIAEIYLKQRSRSQIEKFLNSNTSVSTLKVAALNGYNDYIKSTYPRTDLLTDLDFRKKCIKQNLNIDTIIARYHKDRETLKYLIINGKGNVYITEYDDTGYTVVDQAWNQLDNELLELILKYHPDELLEVKHKEDVFTIEQVEIILNNINHKELYNSFFDMYKTKKEKFSSSISSI